MELFKQHNACLPQTITQAIDFIILQGKHMFFCLTQMSNWQWTMDS